MEDYLTIRILKKGDKVLNVWHSDNRLHIAIKKSKGEIFIHQVERDENGQPRVSTTPKIIITYGEWEVEALTTDQNGKSILSITA